MSPYRSKNSARKIYKGELTRKRLLESAVESFVKHGYEGASFTDLAREAGVNRALFNHYFGSKDRLIVECLHHAYDEGRDLIQAFFDSRPPEMGSIERYFRANFHWLREKRHHLSYIIMCFHRASHDGEMRKAVGERIQAAWGRVVERMRNDPRIDFARISDPLDLARELHMILVGGVALSLGDLHGDIDGHERRCLGAARDILAPLSRGPAA